MGLSLLLLTTAMTSTFAIASNPKWENALKPKGELGDEMTLAKGGKAFYEIIIPASPSTQEQKAAADLSQWLGDMTGARFEVSRESDIAPKGKVISIGETGLLAKSASVISKAELGAEGYAIDEKDGNLFLVGGAKRGPIYAVYALLEEDLGCRWYTRFSQSIPHTPTLRFRPLKRSFVPVLDIRDPFFWNAFDGTWSLRNRTNAPSAPVPAEWGGNITHALFVHTFNTLVPPGKYFKDHPEYYSEIDGKRVPGQLCVSNPEVLKIATEATKAILRSNNSQIISVSQNDAPPCCKCAKCQAITEAEGSISGPLLMFVNAVADEVGKEFPNVKISTLAYNDTFMPPKNIKPRKNVIIHLCTDVHSWSHMFWKIEETEKFQTAMKGWAAIGADIHIWDYIVDFGSYPQPMPNWQVVSDSIRFFVKNNAKGVMLQGAYQSAGGADGAMRSWVWAKQLWDPTLDTQALMKDFVFGYYGKAAEPVWEYEQMLWDLWEKEHNGKLNNYNMSVLDGDFMIKAKDCFKRAFQLADDPETFRRVGEAEVQILYAELNLMSIQVSKDQKTENMEQFNSLLSKFERIAKHEKINYISEASNLDSWMAKLRRYTIDSNEIR